jgi:CubicO group peptidase (beta-lactamase class C family)
MNNGKVNYYGVLIENDSIKPIQNQAKIFEIGSVTKIFTSTVYASLLVDKKLKTNDFINDFFSIPFKNSLKIRFQDLANHTSGLPSLPKNFDLSNLNNPYKNYKIEDLNEYLGGFIEINSSGKYSYSNLGYGLLGFSLAQSQKKTFEELLKQRVFEKYKMSNTFANLKEIKTNLIRGLDENGRETSNWEFDVLLGGGGVLSTTEDLVKFSKGHFHKKNKELELTRKTTYVINENMQIGLGWHVLKTLNGDNWYWHKGGTKGYSSSIALNVEKKNGVIILSNVSSFNLNADKIEKLGFDLMKLIENK